MRDQTTVMARARRTLAIGLLILGFGSAPVARPDDFGGPRKPNVAIIFSDDLRYGDRGAYGHPTIRTSNLDRMAAEGQRWTSFYAQAPVCSSSRSALTGRIHLRSGMFGASGVFFPDSHTGLPADEVTIAEALKTLGYATGVVGKWHLGHRPEYWPTQHVETVRFVHEHRDAPFFLYVPHSMPHKPLFESDEFLGRSSAGVYGDVLEELDRSVGQIFGALQDEGIDGDTPVVLTSDNGPWISCETHAGSAGPLRHGKGTTFEGGMRVPAVFRWPGRIEPGVIKAIGSATDLFATVLSLADGPLPTDRAIDALDLSPVPFGTTPGPRKTMASNRIGELFAFRQGPYKVHCATQGRCGLPPEREDYDPPLYDLDADPGGRYDIGTAQLATVAVRLAAAERHRAGLTVAEPLFDRRDPAASDDLTLAAKARLFEVDIIERFLHDGQLATRRRRPTADRPYVTYNMPDNAYMTGIYSATETWRALVTGDADAARLARSAFAALGHLLEVSGRPGLLARSSVPVDVRWFDDGVWRVGREGGRHRWRGNVSSDQVAGLVFGSLVYYRHLATNDEKTELADRLRALVGAILDDGRRIVGFDGEPTSWGHYEPEYVVNEEPMNALLLLQMVKVAAVVTGDDRFAREYRRLVDEMDYARIGERARRDRPPLRANHSDDVLIALALYPLLELEEDPSIRVHYLEAARRWFEGGAHPGVSAEANPFATFLWHHWTGDTSHDAAALETLRRVPLDMKWNRDTIEAYATRFGFHFEPAHQASAPAAEFPLPIDQRSRTWSFLVDNPYRSVGARTDDAPFETNGLDYLVSYWFGRAHEFVAGDR
jgi:arylsulfatase A